MAVGVRDGTFSTGTVNIGAGEVQGSRMAWRAERAPGRRVLEEEFCPEWLTLTALTRRLAQKWRRQFANPQR